LQSRSSSFPCSASHSFAEGVARDSHMNSSLKPQRVETPLVRSFGAIIFKTAAFAPIPFHGDRKYAARYPLAELKNRSNRSLSTDTQYATLENAVPLIELRWQQRTARVAAMSSAIRSSGTVRASLGRRVAPSTCRSSFQSQVLTTIPRRLIRLYTESFRLIQI
jgi:hypothetical protein